MPLPRPCPAPVTAASFIVGAIPSSPIRSATCSGSRAIGHRLAQPVAVEGLQVRFEVEHDGESRGGGFDCEQPRASGADEFSDLHPLGVAHVTARVDLARTLSIITHTDVRPELPLLVVRPVLMPAGT